MLLASLIVVFTIKEDRPLLKKKTGKVKNQQSLSGNRSLPFMKTLKISFQGIEACFSSSFLYSFGLLVLTVLRPSLPVMLNFIWG